jgi:hypothetical protein
MGVGESEHAIDKIGSHPLLITLFLGHCLINNKTDAYCADHVNIFWYIFLVGYSVLATPLLMSHNYALSGMSGFEPRVLP